MSQLKLPSLAQAADQIGSTGIARLGLGALGIAGVAAAFYFSVYLKLPTFKLAKEPGGRVVPDESEYSKKEQQLTKDLIKADEVATDFSDIGGLRQQIEEIEELVIMPLSHPHLYSHSAIAQQPSGVLLYGPPGTGKTLLAKAIAKQATASFLTFNIAEIESKWFGDTPKLIEAVFSLARKVSPCVIFIDEVDAVLGTRNDRDLTHVNAMKAKILECWDGVRTPVATAGSARDGAAAGGPEKQRRDWVLVIAATNRPWAVDPAVLRRMPRQILIGLPDAAGRAEILKVLLRRERVDESLDVEAIAAEAEGYSGSDLKEVVRAAALVPIREAFQRERTLRRGEGAAAPSGAGGVAVVETVSARPLTASDLLGALSTVRPTGEAAREYRTFQASTARTAFTGPAAAASPVRAAPTTQPSGGVPASQSRPAGGSPSAVSAASAAVMADQFAPVLQLGPVSRSNTQKLTRAIEDGMSALERAMAEAAAAKAAAPSSV